jgi:hypothetical protein
MYTLSRRTLGSLLGATLLPMSPLVHADYKPSKRRVRDYDYDLTRKALVEPLKEFFGNAKGQYIDLRGSPYVTKDPESLRNLYHQFLDIFLQVPGAVVELEGGFRMLYASQAHWSLCKAFVVTSGKSIQIVAAGLLHQFGGMVDAPYDHDHTLTIFYSGKITSNPQINADLIEYYGDFLKYMYRDDTSEKGVKMKVQVRQL